MGVGEVREVKAVQTMPDAQSRAASVATIAATVISWLAYIELILEKIIDVAEAISHQTVGGK